MPERDADLMEGHWESVPYKSFIKASLPEIGLKCGC
jgi:hypothetical protein